MFFRELDSIDESDPADANRQLTRRRSTIYDTCVEITEAIEKGRRVAENQMRRNTWFSSLNENLQNFVRGDLN